MTKTYAQVMSEFAANLAYQDIPDEVVAEAKMRVLDILGLCLATYQMDFAQPVLEVVRQGRGPSESMVIGTDEKFPVASAALANGTTAHGPGLRRYPHPGHGPLQQLRGSHRIGGGGNARALAGGMSSPPPSSVGKPWCVSA